MATRTVSTLKFVGSISVGLLTGLSYTLSTLTLPTLLHLPSAPLAARAINSLSTSSELQLRTLAGISGTSFLFAYLLSPRSQKHPYLLWTILFITTSAFTEYFLPTQKPVVKSRFTTPTTAVKDRKGKGRQMDASFEVLGSASDRDSEGTLSGNEEVEVEEEDVNGEEVRQHVKGFMTSQAIRTAITGLAFAMSVVGIWGDGAADLVIIEM